MSYIPNVSLIQLLYSQHPLIQSQLEIGFISLISKLKLDIGVAGFKIFSPFPFPRDRGIVLVLDTARRPSPHCTQAIHETEKASIAVKR